MNQLWDIIITRVDNENETDLTIKNTFKQILLKFLTNDQIFKNSTNAKLQSLLNADQLEIFSNSKITGLNHNLVKIAQN